MEDIIEIILNKEYDREDLKKVIFDTFSKIIEKTIELEIWDKSIKKIIVTNDFHTEIEKQANEWNIKTFISKEKEFTVVSKVLFNYKYDIPEYYIFFDFINFSSIEISKLRIVFSQILSVKSKSIFPEEIDLLHPRSLEDYVKVISIEWCRLVYVSLSINQILPNTLTPINNNSLLIAFKRKLKKNLYDYNSDKFDAQTRLDVFWNNYIESINILFIRLIENETEDAALQIKQEEPCIHLINSILFEIKKLTQNYFKGEARNIQLLKNAIVNFSAHFDIILQNESSDNFEILLTKNPKDYFIDEIIETEPRIICFMDILGFSELINEYDSDITSTILQDIQESFSLAKNSLVQNIEHNSRTNNEAVKHLKYQTFSDNICISIPFFDNENDFLLNFSLLSTYVRSFQMIMMGKGIFMRGGISIGSYYADNNIIFSKGLVNAYNLESKKAIYPRIIIDNSIISKLISYDSNRIKYFGLDNMLIYDWENLVFLNPFELIKTSIQQIESMFSELSSHDLDDSLSTLINSFKQDMKDITTNLLNNASKEETKGIELLKNAIIKSLIKYHNNEHIASKYLWLLELLKWIEKDESGNLKFEYFKDKIDKLTLS